MYVVRVLNETIRRKNLTPLYIFVDCPVSHYHRDNYYFSISPKFAFGAHYEEKGKKVLKKKHFNVIPVTCFFRYKTKFNKHVQHCNGRPGFVYCFQNESLKTYENYLKHKKNFLFTVTGDLEITTGYILEIEGVSMFATSYCLMFDFHPMLQMTHITCLRRFGPVENELKFLTIPEKFYPYIDLDDLRSFRDACNVVLEKKQKQAFSTLCMIYLLCKSIDWFRYERNTGI